jgi:RNA polymerase sigma-70 factor (ECF subfamily)
VDAACLAAFQQKHRFIRRVFQGMKVAPDDVDDLAQELFIVLRGLWRQYDPRRRPLRFYLFGIAMRMAGAHRRKRRREVPAGLVRKSEPAPAPDRLFDLRESHEMLIAALERIPPPRRSVLVMHELEDVPMTDVASTLSIKLFTAYSRLRKARDEFKGALLQMLGHHDESGCTEPAAVRALLESFR